jgi:hypothetical protein
MMDKAQKPINKYNNPCCTYLLLHAQQDALAHNSSETQLFWLEDLLDTSFSTNAVLFQRTVGD